MSRVLIVANAGDEHARAVTARLKGSAELLDPARIGRMTVRPLDPPGYDAVWLRRAKAFGCHGGEVASMLAGAAQLADVGRWVNHLSAAILNDGGYGKLNQLYVARKHGLSVPDTIATTDPAAAAEFCRGRRCVVKPFAAGSGATWCSEVKATDFSAVERCPTLIQELLDKEADVRAVVMGPTVMATAIRSDRLDFRKGGTQGLEHEPYALPDYAQTALVAVNVELGLSFSVADLVLTKEGDLVFLEANQQGQWLWLEMATGQPYLERFCEFLCG